MLWVLPAIGALIRHIFPTQLNDSELIRGPLVDAQEIINRNFSGLVEQLPFVPVELIERILVARIFRAAVIDVSNQYALDTSGVTTRNVTVNLWVLLATIAD